jgi:hypothetical protein
MINPLLIKAAIAEIAAFQQTLPPDFTNGYSWYKFSANACENPSHSM